MSLPTEEQSIAFHHCVVRALLSQAPSPDLRRKAEEELDTQAGLMYSLRAGMSLSPSLLKQGDMSRINELICLTASGFYKELVEEKVEKDESPLTPYAVA